MLAAKHRVCRSEFSDNIGDVTVNCIHNEKNHVDTEKACYLYQELEPPLQKRVYFRGS